MWDWNAGIFGFVAIFWRFFLLTMPIAVGGLNFFGDEVDRIVEFDPLTGECLLSLEEVTIYKQPPCDASGQLCHGPCRDSS